MTTTTPHEGWGLTSAIPETAETWYGARWIVDMDGYVDIVPDRQNLKGPRADDLAAWLDDSDVRGEISHMLKTRQLHTRFAERCTVLDDDTARFECNTNASAGYLYVAAWLKP